MKNGYSYIRIIHEGEDYLLLKIGKEEIDVRGFWEMRVIKTLLKAINK